MQSIRARTTLFICLLLFAVIGAYAALAYHEMRASATRSAGERLAAGAEDIAATLAGSVDQMRSDVRSAAERSELSIYLRDPASATDDAVREVLDAFAPGNVIHAELRNMAGRSLLGVDLEADRSWIPPRGIGVMSEVGITPLVVDGPVVGYGASAPVTADGRVVGYLVHWRRLQTAEQSRELISRLIGMDASVYLANEGGDVWTDLSTPVAARPVGGTPTDGRATYDRPTGGRTLAASASVAGAPWMIVVEAPHDVVLAHPRAALGRLALFGLLTLVLGGALAWILSGQLTASISSVAAVAKAISGGDYSRRAPVRGRDEIATLGHAFNEMVDSAESARAELEKKVDQLAMTEARHRETRERLEHIVESSRAILFTGQIGEDRLDWISDNVQRWLGYTSVQASEPGWWRNAVHPDDLPAATERLAEWDGHEGVSIEYRIRRADGTYRWIYDERRAAQAPGEGTREVVGVLTDVTDHRHLEVAKQAAEAASKAKNDFLSRMSHELRTPMNAVLGFAQLMVLEARTGDNRESAQQIVKAGKHLLGLIDEVLDISQIEAGRMSMSTEPVSIAQSVRETVDLVQLTARQHDVSIEIDDSCTTDLFVRADQQRLKQVLLNLLSNAIKYNRRGGTVWLSCDSSAADLARIIVRDSGFGIPSDRIASLFVPFERLGAEQTSVEGTGLGLALSRGLIEAMGGQLEVESVEGAGSTFWIELPRTGQPALDPEAPAVPPGPSGDADVPHRTVLFIEDNPANIRLMERVLRRKPGVHLITAMQGSLGLDLAREHRPALILLDLNLPDVSGEVVLRRIRQDPALRDTPVVMISGDAIPSKRTRMIEMGAQAYLTKPFDLDALFAEVNRALQQPGE